MTAVVNWRRGHKYDVRITRGTIYGNPFVLGRDGDRAAVLRYYRHKLATELDRAHTHVINIHTNLDVLRGKVLGCVCLPAACHGTTLAMLADMSRDERREWARRELAGVS